MVAHDVPGLLGDRYEVGRKLGSGATAVVLVAVDRLLGRRVAVKVPFPQLVGDRAFAERFRREARSAARLSHPNVVAIFDVGTQRDTGTGGIDYIVMEFVEGRTLRQELLAGPLPPDEAARVAREVCAGLQAAHGGGLVHRDVKPANIMLGPSGQVKVMDFGVARALDAARLTQTGLVVATAQYASPEQLQGDDVDARSDVYSLGCCLYEMLAGVPPFAGGDPVSVAFRQVHEAPTPLRRRDPLLPVGLAAVAARALEKEPAQRYQTAAEMAADLSRVLAGERSADPPPTVRGAGTAPIEPLASGDPSSTDDPDDWPPTAEPGGSWAWGRWLAVAGAVAAVVLGAALGVRLLGAAPANPSPTAATAPSAAAAPAPTAATTAPTATTATTVQTWRSISLKAGKSVDLDRAIGNLDRGGDLGWNARTGEMTPARGRGLTVLCRYDPGYVPGRVHDPTAMVEALAREAGSPLAPGTRLHAQPVPVPTNDRAGETRCTIHPGTEKPGVLSNGWAISVLVKTSDGNWTIAVAQREPGNRLLLRFATYAVS